VQASFPIGLVEADLGVTAFVKSPGHVVPRPPFLLPFRLPPPGVGLSLIRPTLIEQHATNGAAYRAQNPHDGHSQWYPERRRVHTRMISPLNDK